MGTTAAPTSFPYPERTGVRPDGAQAIQDLTSRMAAYFTDSWIPVPSLGGSYVRGASPEVASLAVIGGVLFGHGIIQRADSNPFSTNSVIPIVASGGLPAASGTDPGLRPAVKINVMASTSSPDASCRVVVNTDGSLSIVTGANSFTYFDLACIHHPIAGVVS